MPLALAYAWRYFNQKTNFPFEVIVVDSGSIDDTLSIVKNFNVKIINILKKEFSYGRALNLGCENAEGKYCVFISAHAIPYDDKWLQNLIWSFKNQKVAGVFGKQIPHKDCNPLTRRHELDHWNHEINIRSTDYFFSNTNSAIRKSIWKKNEFDEDLAIAEDHDWAKRIFKSGFKFVYEPNAVVFHSHNENFKEFFQRNYKEVESSIDIYSKNIIFRYFADVLYNFYKDFIYVIKNGYEIRWIFRSGVNSFLLLIATIFAFVNFLFRY